MLRVPVSSKGNGLARHWAHVQNENWEIIQTSKEKCKIQHEQTFCAKKVIVCYSIFKKSDGSCPTSKLKFTKSDNFSPRTSKKKLIFRKCEFFWI